MGSRQKLTAAVFVFVFAALAAGHWSMERAVNAQTPSGVQAPRFEVDPMWPRPLPNHWLLGNAIGNGRWFDAYLCGIIPKSYLPPGTGPSTGCEPPRS